MKYYDNSDKIVRPVLIILTCVDYGNVQFAAYIGHTGGMGKIELQIQNEYKSEVPL